MITRILERLKTGNYKYFKEPSFDRFRKPNQIYDLGNGIRLETYTGDCFFLIVDNETIRTTTEDDLLIVTAIKAGAIAKLAAC